MYIKRIEIDGFKSYAQKQVVDKFDPQFNAITGLNGSGKSNILDAICFVLGISNLQQVRATQLSDLVYKQGQAGVTKATVTITFDNSDKRKPVGYSEYKEIIIRRQIIINGRNTYTINGSAATNKRVADLFHSVGLNVNNPHFLIMQGRITKVLNMKPNEILGMIEEAAGTQMYEKKKNDALDKIQKKEGKVAEIDRVMNEDIIPQVEKLKHDRNNFLEYQKIDRDIEKLTWKLIAYDYISLQVAVGDHERRIKEMHEKQADIDKKCEAIEMDVADKVAHQKELESAKKEKNIGERSEMEENVKRLLAAVSVAESSRDEVREKQKEILISVERIKKSLVMDKRELAKKNHELEEMEAKEGGDEKREQELEEIISKARSKLEALAKGMTTDEQGCAMTLEAQLIAQRTALSELETKVKKADMRLKTLIPGLLKKKNELSKLSLQATSETKELSELEEKLAKMEFNIKQLGFDSEEEKRLSEEARSLTSERSKLTDFIDNFEAKHPNLRFEYTDPEPNFNRDLVKGLVAKLFRIKELRFATALEVAGGGNLSNVVVQNAETGRELISRGNLSRRVTMIPLDKIEGRVADNRKLERAKYLVGEGNVFLAKDLVQYDKQLEPVMRFVFGNTLICTTSDFAKKVTYDRQIMMRSVAISGEDYSPSGTLTGGSRPNKIALLTELDDVLKNGERVSEIDIKLKRINEKLMKIVPLRQRFTDMSAEREKISQRLNIIKEGMKHSPLQLLSAEIEAMEKEIADHRNVVESCNGERTILKSKVEQLELRKKNEKAFQEKEKKQTQSELNSAEKELINLKKCFEKAKASLATLREEIITLQKTIEEQETEIERENEKKAEMDKKFEELGTSVQLAKENLNAGQAELQKLTESMRKHDATIRKCMEEINRLKIQLKELAVERDILVKDESDCRNQVEIANKRKIKMEKTYRWINEEKVHFGKQNTGYDFTSYSVERGKAEIEEKKSRKMALEKTMNPKAMHMLGSAEEQCRQLEIKKEILERDKKQLLEVINRLDIQKEEDLLRAHEKINRDFNTIFSTLLVGASAKLEPPPGAKNALEGLEVKVAFNNKWKDSLGELSGGQKSLVALSLVLAMLKFNPAPIYILDEVDAALDISHTQNIGAMIKTHFKESQFIIVSLKDGMFNNANVVFKTRFVDGTSTVIRMENKEHSSNAESNILNNQLNRAGM
ncbi:hypothetical protein AB6A40_001833 [Gnathostoma spinigerum]|uniref:Structural maintenance of chromosomes protein n=1 Tax=Gnathostoma spinigerum TaxID=75299 RepID=A0ABD6ECS7_9BILA